MFRNIKFTHLFLALMVIFTSCKKEELEKPNNTNINTSGNYTPEGVTWVVSQAIVYVENLDNGAKSVYDHFGPNKFKSCLAIYGESNVKMDSIKQNLTTWFFSNNKFTLNGTEQFNYTNYDDRVLSPIGLHGGTARPIEMINVNSVSMTVKVHEAYGNDGVNNFKFWTILTFIKSGETCSDCGPNHQYGYTYSGTWNTPLQPTTETMAGTRWVVTKFRIGFSIVEPNDTLDFISNTKYTISFGNGFSSPTERNYNLAGVIGNPNKSLTLYQFATVGTGNYSGQIGSTSITDGMINEALFNETFNTGGDVYITMVKLP